MAFRNAIVQPGIGQRRLGCAAHSCEGITVQRSQGLGRHPMP